MTMLLSRRAVGTLSLWLGAYSFVFLVVGCGDAANEIPDPPPEVVAQPHPPESVVVDPSSSRGTVRVVLHGLRSPAGNVGCALFTSENGFPQDASAANQAAWCAIVDATAVCEFTRTPAGPCAIGCFHDEDGNGALATGLYGIPLEGIAASRDALCVMGPPRYEDARWDYTGEPTVLQLTMTYNVKAKAP